jgi:PhzF family phenazine biosynthesis protein
MAIPIFQVDSFTGEAFRGNPAGVCVLDENMDAGWMQAVAAEMNVSETGFLVPCAEEPGAFSIRWFTPTVEVPLCGHGTLASAHILWEQGFVTSDGPVVLNCKKGRLTACRENGRIRLDFPEVPALPIATPPRLADALGVQPLSVYENEFPAGLVELESAEAVRALDPDIERLEKVGPGCWIVTALSDTEDCDFVSRFFAPRLGINEDPVTGSAHCSLGPFWAERLRKTELIGHQVSKRGGVVGVRVLGARIHLLGQTVTVLRGELTPEATRVLSRE